jgi:hypothetical protein
MSELIENAPDALCVLTKAALATDKVWHTSAAAPEKLWGGTFRAIVQIESREWEIVLVESGQEGTEWKVAREYEDATVHPALALPAGTEIYHEITAGFIRGISAGGGGGGDKNFVHAQGEPAAVWTITHNLGKRPSVTVQDTAGDEVEGVVEYLNEEELKIVFTAPVTGEAYLN